MAIINISDPTNPGAPVYEDTSGTASGVYVSGNYAYIADGGSGLAIINVSVHGNYAYVADYGSGLAVYVSVHGNYAYVADYGSGLAVIHIREMLSPIVIDTSGDFSVDFGYIGVSLSWIATDQDPNNYTIALQGTGIVSGPSAWSNGTEVTYNVPNGLPVGDYIYTINFTDDFGNFTTDTITMSVLDVANPIITKAPSDFTVDFGYTGVNISWTATDQTPDTYSINLQGTGIVSGPSAWSNGTEVVYIVPEDLISGEHIYTINFTDDFDNYVKDAVTITVNEAVKQDIPGYDLFYIIGIAVIISAVFMKRHKWKR